ncbi:outer membrane protein assembly factor BamA [Pelovirga terrestris]|uniref:Outer membrane protein assembly factor BamA n=1 Tax=Pelovirga terrestris TaxID=2771352 RepID=A0A8J6R649_9BACT|nr:outer membrane protein assembly factor BamA [Pelovirga terrestris]MBD1401004.1 outer membrane protein assembly factor BamA [Pelovirga terrestris]
MSRSLMVALFLVFVATFSLAAEEFRVAQVQIEGNRRVATAAIRGAITINPGDVVSYAQVDENLKNIFALGGFHDVTARIAEVQGSTILVFELEEQPLVRTLEFRDNKKLSDQKLRDNTTLKPPFIFDHNRVRNSVQELKNVYIKDAYHAVDINTQLNIDNRGEATLVYLIDEGRKIRVKNINFIGNEVLKKRALLKSIETKERWFLSWLTGRGVYLEEVIEIDIERIKMAYYDIGYQDVIVQQPQVTLIDNKYLNIDIEIDEGPQYRVGALRVSGDLLFPEDELLKQVQLKEGEVFSRLQLRDSILALTDLYADRGYAYVNVVPLTARKADELLFDIELEIEQGVQVSIERVDISGNIRTRDKVIRREIPVIEGELYSSSKMKEANRRVRNLGFFEEVQITDKRGSAEDLSVVEVAVEERLTGTFSIGLGYSSVDKLMAQGSISQENFLGRGLTLNLSGSVGSKSNTYSLAVTDPYFLDTDWTLGGEVYRSQREFRDYDDERTGGAIRAGHSVSRNSRVFLTYRYEQKEITNLSAVALANQFIADQEGRSTLSSITTQWVRNSTDFFEDPSRGGVTRISLEYAGLGGTEHFLRPIASHRHFFPLFWGTVFSIHGEIGYITSTRGDEVSLSERFFLGGIRTIRGFKTREVGPRGDDGIYIGGEKMGYFNMEYLFPIYRSLGLQGVLFYDTGNAWRDNEEYFSDMRHSAGAGIRWRSPLGPLRFEWGYNLDPRDDEKQSVFEFTIGRPF